MGSFPAGISAPSRAGEFRDALAAGVLTADGAMGTMLATMLASRGAFASRCLEELNLSLAAMVRDVHQEYLRAGARILGTNTFGANRARLEKFGFAAKTRAINQAGVRIAREAARNASGEEPAFVAGVAGPLGTRLEPFGPAGRAQARALFREQFQALLESGVDLLLLETFQDLAELEEAVSAAREAGGAEIPLVASVSVEEDGTLACGASVSEFTTRLEEWQVDVIGLNCSSGPRVLLDTAAKVSAWTNRPLSLMPNAGLPAIADGRAVYPCSPEYFANFAKAALGYGARILGGCCGTTPEHIRRIRQTIAESLDVNQFRVDQPPRNKHTVVLSEDAAEPDAGPAASKASRSQLGARLTEHVFAGIIEMPTPRGPDASAQLVRAKEYQAAGIDFIAIGEGLENGARWDSTAACHAIQRGTNVECLLPFGRGDAQKVQRELLGAHALGIRNVVCSVANLAAVAVAAQLNRGLDLGGHGLGSRTSLLIGVRVSPFAADLDAEVRRFELSVNAGADFAITRPVFDLDLFEEFLRRVEPYQIPIVAGIQPLTGLRDAEYFIHERSTPVPADYLEWLRDERSAEAEGLAISTEMVERLREMVSGVYWSGRLGALAKPEAIGRAIG